LKGHPKLPKLLVWSPPEPIVAKAISPEPLA
jgi:hypothetical protein